MTLVAEQLRDSGFEVRFSSFGEAADYVKRHGFVCETVPPVEFSWSMEGGFSIKHSLSKIPSWFLNFARQFGRETSTIVSYSPDVVLSDSRLSPILAASFLNVPSLVVLNQIKLLLSPRLRDFAIARFFEQMVGEFLGLMWDRAGRILVPDLPPPYTISAHNLWGIDASRSRLEYVGFTSRRPSVTLEQMHKVASMLLFDPAKPIVFVHISGPKGTREPLVRLAMEASRMLPETQIVISGGIARGSVEPSRLGHNGWYYEWCPIRDELFAMASLIVMRGGHTALSQAIQFGKPVVTIPIENHGEQLGNAEKISELGAGIMLSPKRLTAAELKAAIQKGIEEPSFKQRALEMMDRAESLDGTKNIADIVKTYL